MIGLPNAEHIGSTTNGPRETVLGFYILSHLFELFFFARYLWLKALFKITGRPVTYLPQWAVDSKASFLQPAMWDLSLVDAIIDDSRIRKVLG